MPNVETRRRQDEAALRQRILEARSRATSQSRACSVSTQRTGDLVLVVKSKKSARVIGKRRT